jgi:hypothetical protein
MPNSLLIRIKKTPIARIHMRNCIFPSIFLPALEMAGVGDGEVEGLVVVVGGRVVEGLVSAVIAVCDIVAKGLTMAVPVPVVWDTVELAELASVDKGRFTF